MEPSLRAAMKQMKQQLSPKRRLIVIWTVALILPIIVLIVFEYISLSNIKSTHAINAVIQRDFAQTLQVVERKSNEELKSYARNLADALESPALPELPDQELHAMIDGLLEKFSFADAIFYYQEKRGLTMEDRQSLALRTECDSLHVKKTMLKDVFQSEQFAESVESLRDYSRKNEFMVVSLGLRRSENQPVSILVYFAVPPYRGTPSQVAGFLLSGEFLSREFFPRIFRQMETESMTADRRDLRSTIIAIHYMNEPQNIIASSQPMDSFDFEVAKIMGYGPWRFFVSEIKPKGKTIEGIASSYIRWNFLLVTFMVAVLVMGMLLTLRNMAREMQLAQLKSDFVSNVSHELKTPLALIRLFAETLELDRVKSPGRRKEYFNIIRKESERLTHLINNILDFSKIEAGKKEYKFAPESVSEVVQETVDSYRYPIEQEGFALKTEISDTLPRLWIDRDAISQALLNLLNNAIKYSKDEKFIGVTVAQDARTARIEVVDHGIGIAKSDQKKIFEKFYRASNSLVHDTKGSGLGLSLVQHIMMAHGGEVTVESKLGEGSRFSLLLPLAHSIAGETSDSVSEVNTGSAVVTRTERIA